jgi:biotin operon repressor
MILAALGFTSPRTKRQLADATGWNTRDVEAAIQQARLEGAPICSDERGYWLGTAEEVRACADRLRRRYVTQAVTARALRRTARRLEAAQMSLWVAA